MDRTEAGSSTLALRDYSCSVLWLDLLLHCSYQLSKLIRFLQKKKKKSTILSAWTFGTQAWSSFLLRLRLCSCFPAFILPLSTRFYTVHVLSFFRLCFKYYPSLIVSQLFDAEQVCDGFFRAFQWRQLPTEARDGSNKKVNENIKVVDRSME